jgi:excisionase family DNA binding protein
VDRLLLRPEEVAEMLGLSRARVYQLLALGAIPSLKVMGGKSRRIRMADLQQWINEHPSSVAKEATLQG